jgi:hypothetical protein
MIYEKHLPMGADLREVAQHLRIAAALMGEGEYVAFSTRLNRGASHQLLRGLEGGGVSQAEHDQVVQSRDLAIAQVVRVGKLIAKAEADLRRAVGFMCISGALFAGALVLWGTA